MCQSDNDIWQDVEPFERFGIVTYNFNNARCQKEYSNKLFESLLSLSIGESVIIIKKYRLDWYFGYGTRNRYLKGVFPQSYINVCQINDDLIYDEDGIFEPKRSKFVQEITTVLLDWGQQLRNLYLMDNEKLKQFSSNFFDLADHRSELLRGTIPADELNDTKSLIVYKIDVGNKILGLDVTVRDENGSQLNVDRCSTLHMFAQHKLVSERVKKDWEPKKKVKGYKNQVSHIFFVFMRNFVCKMNEDAELLMTLYDGRDFKPITENYVIKWSKEGLASNIDQLNNFKVLFTDLGNRDMLREKIYLVCYVVRIGEMDVNRDSIDGHKRSLQSTPISLKKLHTTGMRRPFGIALMDVTGYVSGKLDSDDKNEHFVPFIQCCERDNFDSLLRKVITNKEYVNKTENKGQGLWISLKLLSGDINQLPNESSLFIAGRVSIARKMGFADVILPGDIRNDVYVTLVSGEFSKCNKSTEKNVEVVLTVCNLKGDIIPNVVSIGSGVDSISEYRSTIYYHEDKPRWCETIKICVSIDEFKTAHLKFTFKHRSSTEAKDKAEKPFAMSFVPLMQSNGTTLKDNLHDLLVYKIDYKKFQNDSNYSCLPSERPELLLSENQQKANNISGLTLNTKDVLIISTNICSTKLTQNIDLLGLLNWNSEGNKSLKRSLQDLTNVDGDEAVKFLQDILDALFNIMMEFYYHEEHDGDVFDCLLYIITLINDRKYQHFQPVVDSYIANSFSATLADSKLMAVLKSHIDKANLMIEAIDKDLLLKTMKSLHYLFKFIVRSRLLFCELYDDRDQNVFECELKDLLNSIVIMMGFSSDNILLIQGACLRYLPTTISDILLVFDARKLSYILINLIKKVAPNRLMKQKMMTINDIVHSKLFQIPESRLILLPVFTQLVKECLEANEELELCVKILSDVMELLFVDGQTNDGQFIVNEISEIMLTDLRTVIQTTIAMDRENVIVGHLVAVMIEIFRQMKSFHYEQYINAFSCRSDVLDFLMEILLVFRDLVNRSVFPNDWIDMIMLQNAVILKSLRFFSHTIRDYFFEKFDYQAWNNFFHCAISFMTQPALQFETFSRSKRLSLLKKYKDMRQETGFEIRTMWFNLGHHKIQFVPGLVGSFLEMTLIPERELRQVTIPIFFDMMQCEFYSSKIWPDSLTKDASEIKGQFIDFENEMITKLDTLVEGGKGDECYRIQFEEIMSELCAKHVTMREPGLKFVRIVARLMDLLLEYRKYINDENRDIQMSCTVQLLDFYSEINRKEMYIRYLNKLCDLHLESENYTEAACTLQLHSNLLTWSDTHLSPLLKSHRYNFCQTHRDLKEALYHRIIQYFDKGKMWEYALHMCQELAKQYQNETFNYISLSRLHKRMADFYDAIINQMRPESEYFRVAFYGRGFPQFIQNKSFVYRGKEYDRLSDFSNRILNQFPNAELMTKLTPPDDSITESYYQYIQINKVEPIMDEQRQSFSGKTISNQIVQFYKVNDVRKFRYSRPYHLTEDSLIENNTNEFATLWLERTVIETSQPLPGILRWFAVIKSEVLHISPLCTAIETMQTTNQTLKDLILQHYNDRTLSLNPLSLKLHGIVDAAVNGGISNYEKAFFSDLYLQKHPEDEVLIEKLKMLLAEQIPLLEIGVQLHRVMAPQSLMPFQQRLADCFGEMQAKVVSKYGKKVCDLPISMSKLKHQSMIIDDAGEHKNEHRQSNPLPQMNNTLRSLTATFNFGTASPVVNRLISYQSSRSSSSTSSLKKLKKKKSMKIKNVKDRESITSSTSMSSMTSGFGSNTNSGTQWYATEESFLSSCSSLTLTEAVPPVNSSRNSSSSGNGNGKVVELTEELTPKRPLRSEVEKERRLSRPLSGQYQTSRPSSMISSVTALNSDNSSSNRDSIGTTDSSSIISEDDLIPPPLPLKNRELETTSINENHSFLHSNRSQIRKSLMRSKTIAAGQISDPVVSKKHDSVDKDTTISSPQKLPK